MTAPGGRGGSLLQSRRATPKLHLMRRLLIAAGLLIVLVGLAWPWLSRLPLGRLPGDLVIDRPGFRFYAPFATMLIVSLVVSFILWLMRR